MTKTNYKAEYKRAKEHISELQSQITTLKDRLDVLRKAKNQTILKTEIINRDISEPVFGQNAPIPAIPVEEKIIEVERKVSTIDAGVNTVDVFLLSPPSPSEEVAQPKRRQRIRVKENWAQCKIFTDNKSSQASFVQTCHCEGVGNDSDAKPQGSPAPKTLSTLSNATAGPNSSTPAAPEPQIISKAKTKDFISSDAHVAEIAVLEAAFKSERDKQRNIHAREVSTLKQTIEKLSDALKKATEENVKQTLTSPNGASVFHLYAEEKKRMEEQVRHVNQENHKLRSKLSKVTQELRDKEEEWEENEESIRKHCVETWDEQYRSWITKTETKMKLLRDSNENMQNFIMKNAKHLPFDATDELTIYDEYGEKVTVFHE